MKSRALLSFAVVVAASTFICSQAAHARSSSSIAASNAPSNMTAAKQEATQMVPAAAVLTQEIDARKMHSGEQFHARLTKAVHLKNGADLPKGTNLIGTIASDKMNPDGTSTLALQFTTAHTKNGKNVPIVATIVDIAPPASASDWALDDGTIQPLAWDGTALKIDQIKAASGFDLHSMIAGSNSGMFVSKKKDEVKLANQTQLSLAIAARHTGAESGGA